MLPVGYCDHLVCVVCGKYHSVGKPAEVIEHERRWDGVPQLECRQYQKVWALIFAPLQSTIMGVGQDDCTAHALISCLNYYCGTGFAHA